jgi:hypothetical protein
MSKTSEGNLGVMQRTLRAFQAGDMATLTELFDENVVWHVPGRNPMAADYRGRDATFAFFGRLMEATGGTFNVESLDMLANDRGGVFVDRLTARREGRNLDVRLMLHVTIRDGRIVEGVDHIHQEHLWDAFWA